MKRFFGMMPRNEIGKEKPYADKYRHLIIIQAGPHGWTILFADHSSEFEDVDDTTENNFKKAYKKATEYLGPLDDVVVDDYAGLEDEEDEEDDGDENDEQNMDDRRFASF